MELTVFADDRGRGGRGGGAGGGGRTAPETTAVRLRKMVTKFADDEVGQALMYVDPVLTSPGL